MYIQLNHYISTTIAIVILWIIWMAKCIEWEINPTQDLSTMHTINYFVALTHNVDTGKLHQGENYTDLEILFFPFLRLARSFPYWGLASIVHAYIQMADSSLL